MGVQSPRKTMATSEDARYTPCTHPAITDTEKNTPWDESANGGGNEISPTRGSEHINIHARSSRHVVFRISESLGREVHRVLSGNVQLLICHVHTKNRPLRSHKLGRDVAVLVTSGFRRMLTTWSGSCSRVEAHVLSVGRRRDGRVCIHTWPDPEPRSRMSSPSMPVGTATPHP